MIYCHGSDKSNLKPFRDFTLNNVISSIFVVASTEIFNACCSGDNSQVKSSVILRNNENFKLLFVVIEIIISEFVDSS